MSHSAKSCNDVRIRAFAQQATLLVIVELGYVCRLLLIRVSQVRDPDGLPKLEDLPCGGVFERIRVARHQVNRHPDSTAFIEKYQITKG